MVNGATENLKKNGILWNIIKYVKLQAFEYDRNYSIIRIYTRWIRFAKLDPIKDIR